MIFWFMTLLPVQLNSRVIPTLLSKWLLWFQASYNPCLSLAAGIGRQKIS